jgi:hypothetical protein
MSRINAVPLLLVLAAAAHADVTVRYAFDVKPSPSLPPQAVEAMRTQMSKPMVLRIKGNKAYGEVMGMTVISDFDGALVTVLDPANKRYATASSTEYAATVAKSAELPAEARKVLDTMKFDVQTRATGRAQVIKGIHALEREIVFTVGLPAGQGPSPGDMRTVYSVWTPDSEELIRNPILRELSQYAARAYVGMNPADVFTKMFGQTPGMGEKMRAMTEAFKDVRVMLGSRSAVYMPGMAAMMEQLRKAGQPVPQGLDPNAPLMETVMDLQELSGAPVSPAVFKIPQDYAPAPLADVLKAVMPQRAAGMPRQ